MGMEWGMGQVWERENVQNKFSVSKVASSRNRVWDGARMEDRASMGQGHETGIGWVGVGAS